MRERVITQPEIGLPSATARPSEQFNSGLGTVGLSEPLTTISTPAASSSKVALLTGGQDKPYVLGLAHALAQQG